MISILNILFYHPVSEATPNSKITGAYWAGVVYCIPCLSTSHSSRYFTLFLSVTFCVRYETRKVAFKVFQQDVCAGVCGRQKPSGRLFSVQRQSGSHSLQASIQFIPVLSFFIQFIPVFTFLSSSNRFLALQCICILYTEQILRNIRIQLQRGWM